MRIWPTSPPVNRGPRRSPRPAKRRVDGADLKSRNRLERAELTGEYDPAMFAWRKKAALRLRYLERVPLGTPYPDIVERVSGVNYSSRSCCLS